MTEKDRVTRVVHGDNADRFPSQLDFVPNRLRNLLNEIKMTPKEFDDFAGNHIFYAYPLTESCYYSSGSAEDEELLDLAVRKGLIDAHPDSRMIYDNFHVSWLKNTDGIRNTNAPLEELGIDRFQWPDPSAQGIFDHVLPSLEKSRNRYYTVGLQHLGLFERAHILLGYERFMIALSEDIALVEALLDRILEFHLGLALRFLELGVDAVRTGDDYGMQEGLQIAPATWRKLIKPRIARIWQLYRNAGITVFHHTCGDVTAIIPDMVEIGLEVLHPVQPKAMSIERLSSRFGDKLAFFGGIDTQELLPFGSPQEVKNAVKECMEVLGRNGRYIVAPSQEIMNDVPTANIMAMVEAIQDQGQMAK